jgi:hypothetical protein
MVAALSGDDQNGNVPRALVGGEFLQDRVAVKDRQAEVQHDDVGLGLLQEVQRGQSVAGLPDIKPGERERVPKQATQVRVIFDYENCATAGHSAKITEIVPSPKLMRTARCMKRSCTACSVGPLLPAAS